jgi:poly(A) polymerase
VLAHWEKIKAKGEAKIPALCTRRWTRCSTCRARSSHDHPRIAGDIKDIWALQRAAGGISAPASVRTRCSSSRAFRAGFDFLLLLAQAGEIDMEMADWWTRASRTSDGDKRAEDAAARSGRRQEKRRRRKKKPANGDVDPRGDE